MSWVILVATENKMIRAKYSKSKGTLVNCRRQHQGDGWTFFGGEIVTIGRIRAVNINRVGSAMSDIQDPRGKKSQ